MQQRHLPRHKSGFNNLSVNPGRPLPMPDIGVKSAAAAQYFPDSVDRIPPCEM